MLTSVCRPWRLEYLNDDGTKPEKTGELGLRYCFSTHATATIEASPTTRVRVSRFTVCFLPQRCPLPRPL